MSELITRKELAKRAQARGLRISERTLRYWAERGLIPRPAHKPGEGRKAYYPSQLLERLVFIESLRRKSITEIKSLLERRQKRKIKLGQEEVEVEELRVFEDCGYSYSFARLGDGTIVLTRRKKWAGGNT